MADLCTKYSCTYCQEDISGLRVKCVECVDFELCLQCFSAGAEIGTHRYNHAYQFVDPGAGGISFGRKNWSAREELHLLDAIEFYGFGNWEDISSHIETKTPEEAKEEYIARFIDGNIGRLTWPAALNLRPNLSETSNLDNGPLSPTTSLKQPPLDITIDEAAHLGYMPLRDDFEREFDNEAESLVSPLFISGTEKDDLDIALKLVQVDIYTRRLRERGRRKRVVRDYQLVSQFFSSSFKRDRTSHKKKLSKEEKDFQDRMRVFSQFHTAQEHEQFLQNIQREEDVKLRLSELSRYRQNGLTHHEECAHFEQEAYQHDLFREKQTSVGSCGASVSPQQGHQLIATLLKRKEKNDESARCSTERKCTLRSLGNRYKDNDIPEENVSKGKGKEHQPHQQISAHLLTQSEVQTCSNLDITPAEFLSLKAVLVNTSLDTTNDTSIQPTQLEYQLSKYFNTRGWSTNCQ